MSEPFRDAIGDRLDRPELVPAEYQHLIADDQQRVKRILDFPVSGRVLDVGCSDGAITRRIAKQWGVAAFGCDKGPLRSEWSGAFEWDARESWPGYPDDELFDAVYACEVFEHLTDADTKKALANILGVLKPGGDLIVTVPNVECHIRYVAGCRDRWKWPDHRTAWNKDGLSMFLWEHFKTLEFVPLYDGERPEDSIWLIVRAKGKR